MSSDMHSFYSRAIKHIFNSRRVFLCQTNELLALVFYIRKYNTVQNGSSSIVKKSYKKPFSEVNVDCSSWRDRGAFIQICNWY